jgi:hypothetical protein
MEPHAEVMRKFLHFVDNWGFYASVKPFVAALFAVIHVKVVYIVADNVAHVSV